MILMKLQHNIALMRKKSMKKGNFRSSGIICKLHGTISTYLSIPSHRRNVARR